MPTMDFSTVKAQEPLPVGTYTAAIVAAEETQSKAGNPMINLQWKVSGGKSDGRIVFDSLVFSEKTLGRVKATLISLGFPKDFKGNIGPAELIGKNATIVLDIEQSTQTDPDSGEPYPPRNRVKKVKPLGAQPATDAAPAARGVFGRK